MPHIPPQPSGTVPALARLIVDLDALGANYRELRRHAPQSLVAAVVKANAYGLGMPAVARTLADAGCDTYFVATVDEALELRALLPTVCIYTLGGVPGDSAAVLAAARVRPVLNSLEEARRWAVAGGGEPSALQLDSGLTRAGFDAAELDRLCADPALPARLGVRLLVTHYGCADEPARPQNEQQRLQMLRLRARLPGLPVSMANSAGILLGPAYHGDVVRPGLALYGVRPSTLAPEPMREVARLEALVLQVRELAAPAEVGYGATVSVPAGTRIAILGAGYADGYPRSLGNGVGQVQCEGGAAPVLGRVSMDLITVDLTAVPGGGPVVGDYVTLFGGGQPLERVALAAGTIGYEILTGIGSRVVRQYRGGPGR